MRVRLNCERATAELLRNEGYTEFTPVYCANRRGADRSGATETALFPGYVFCRFDPGHRLPILQIPGVVDVVRFGSQLVPVDESEIAAIQRAVQSGAEVAPWPYSRLGRRARVLGGPLKGLEGILADADGSVRLILSVTLLQKSVSVEVDRSEVEPIL